MEAPIKLPILVIFRRRVWPPWSGRQQVVVQKFESLADLEDLEEAESDEHGWWLECLILDSELRPLKLALDFLRGPGVTELRLADRGIDAEGEALVSEATREGVLSGLQ